MNEHPGEGAVVMNVDEVAELLRVSTNLVRQLASRGALRGHKVGREWRFYRDDVLAYVRGQAEPGES